MKTLTYLCLAILFCMPIKGLCATVNENSSETNTQIQRVRIDVTTSTGYTRHLLLGFTPNNAASDGVDYGYDALNPDSFANDCNWMIGDDGYVIQGVGEFNTSKYYPLGMLLTNTGDISISLDKLENFENEIEVYLYDSLLDSYTRLNEANYDQNLSADTYLDRFYITFSTTAHIEINNSPLSISDDDLSNLKIWHSNSRSLLHINGITNSSDATFRLYNMEGKKVTEEKITNQSYAVNTSGISSGIYIVKIDSDTFSHSVKVCLTN